MSNVGKDFENQIRSSILKLDNVYYLRLPDPPQSFTKDNDNGLRFSNTNPYDFIMYTYPYFFTIENKSSGTDSLSWTMDKSVKGKQIKENQITGLFEAYKKGAIAGFLFNFRTENVTYFMHIMDFMQFIVNSTKKSINLKDIQKKPSLAKTLPVWDQQLAEAGSFIIQQRHSFHVSLQEIAQKIHKRISDDSEELSLYYKSSIPYKAGTAKEIQENFVRELEVRQAEDIERGLTGRGCHRDDMVFHINGIDVRLFGSQGQKRTTVLSLKLSELEFMFRETGEYPLLLLDDAMSELDSFRQKMLLEYIDKVQTFATVTDLDQFPDIRNRESKVFLIQAGKAVSQGRQPF
jgi:penicillin-binding protein-related factor A (putative recombinase)